MNLRRAFCGLILPAFLAASAVDPAFAAPGTSKTYTYTGNVPNFCKVGTSTSYSISIAVVNISHGQMGTTITLDGASGTQQQSNNQDALVTKDYATLCNLSTQQTLTLTAPQAKSGSNVLPYTITVFNGSGGGGTQVASISVEQGTAKVVIPAQTSATWSIKITAINKNSLTAGTYLATATIQ